MGKQRGVRAVSRIDVLVLAAACLLLVVLVPVLLARPRERASRVLCGANLGRIGKTMLIYANDYDGALPRAGGPTTQWGPLYNWVAPSRWVAYNVNPTTNEGGHATFSSCFYLLVKYYQVPTRLFICPGDVGAREFRLADLPAGAVWQGCRLADCWEFGPTLADAFRACSYTYHVPFGPYALTTGRDPNCPVAADRNPWLSTPGASLKVFPGSGPERFLPDVQGFGGTSQQGRKGNAITHQEDGQNVLFLDGRVRFEARAYCGIHQDNIYTVAANGSDTGDPFGTPPVASTLPVNKDDCLLMHDDIIDRAGATVPSGRVRSLPTAGGGNVPPKSPR
jgi:hypothetical protein